MVCRNEIGCKISEPWGIFDASLATACISGSPKVVATAMAKVAYANEKFYPKKNQRIGDGRCQYMPKHQEHVLRVLQNQESPKAQEGKKGHVLCCQVFPCENILPCVLLTLWSPNVQERHTCCGLVLLKSSQKDHSFQFISQGRVWSGTLPDTLLPPTYFKIPKHYRNSKRSILGTGETTKTCDQKAWKGLKDWAKPMQKLSLDTVSDPIEFGWDPLPGLVDLLRDFRPKGKKSSPNT